MATKIRLRTRQIIIMTSKTRTGVATTFNLTQTRRPMVGCTQITATWSLARSNAAKRGPLQEASTTSNLRQTWSSRRPRTSPRDTTTPITPGSTTTHLLIPRTSEISYSIFRQRWTNWIGRQKTTLPGATATLILGSVKSRSTKAHIRIWNSGGMIQKERSGHGRTRPTNKLSKFQLGLSILALAKGSLLGQAVGVTGQSPVDR